MLTKKWMKSMLRVAGADFLGGIAALSVGSAWLAGGAMAIAFTPSLRPSLAMRLLPE